MRCSVLPPHLNFIRKATVCLHSFIPICADRVTVGMVILMSLPFVPGIAERMEELGYDQLLRAYEDKYGKKYPPFRMEIHKEGGLAYMEELRAQFPGEDIDALIKQYTDPRPYSVIQKEILEEFEKTLKKPL